MVFGRPDVNQLPYYWDTAVLLLQEFKAHKLHDGGY